MAARDQSTVNLPPAELARAYCERLVKLAQVESVCLLGSVARGEEHPGSDVDLLVIATEPTRPSQLDEELGRPAAISLLCHTRESFSRLVVGRAVFAIHVRDEGKVLFDRRGWLGEQLAALAGAEADPSATYRWASREVDRYRDLARFNGIYHFAFSRLYSISRAVAIGMTVQGGEAKYGKDEPFAWVASHVPGVRDPAKRLSALRPFRELDGGYDGAEPPFEDRGADSKIRQAVQDLDALLAATDAPDPDSPEGLRLRR